MTIVIIIIIGLVKKEDRQGQRFSKREYSFKGITESSPATQYTYRKESREGKKREWEKYKQLEHQQKLCSACETVNQKNLKNVNKKKCDQYWKFRIDINSERMCDKLRSKPERSELAYCKLPKTHLPIQTHCSRPQICNKNLPYMYLVTQASLPQGRYVTQS